MRILVVDDHDAMREAIADSLADFGEVVGEAVNGRQAVDLVSKLDPDVVVMDLRMPEMDGIEATREIKNRWPDVRIVAYTAYNDQPLVEEILAAGADAFALKGTDLSLEILVG